MTLPLPLWDRILLANEESRRFMIADKRAKRYCRDEVRDIEKNATRDPEALIPTPED